MKKLLCVIMLLQNFNVLCVLDQHEQFYVVYNSLSSQEFISQHRVSPLQNRLQEVVEQQNFERRMNRLELQEEQPEQLDQESSCVHALLVGMCGAYTFMGLLGLYIILT